MIDQYMGWSRTGNTRVKYQHYFSDDAHIAKLEADGFLPKGSSDAAKKRKELLRPKSCPNCSEPNKPDSRFCSKCKFVLTFDAYNEKVQDTENMKKALAEIQTKQTAFETILKKMVASDLDVDVNDPEEQERIAHTLEKVLASKWQLFTE